MLAEEMHRVVAFFNWEEQWWKLKAGELGAFPSEKYNPLIEGKIAYAFRQASIRHVMRNHYELSWKGLAENLTSLPNHNAQIMIECH